VANIHIALWQRFPISGLFEEETKRFNYILTTSIPDITSEEVDQIDEIGVKIAAKAYQEIKKGNRQLGWIKTDGIKEAKETSERLKEFVERDGNLDFLFGWCFTVGRDYGYGTPEVFKKSLDGLMLVKKK